MSNAVNGFQKTGIWPPDRDVFSNDDSLAADTTEIAFPSCESHLKKSYSYFFKYFSETHIKMVNNFVPLVSVEQSQEHIQIINMDDGYSTSCKSTTTVLIHSNKETLVSTSNQVAHQRSIEVNENRVKLLLIKYIFIAKSGEIKTILLYFR